MQVILFLLFLLICSPAYAVQIFSSSGGGSGDMSASVYDTDGDGEVNEAEALAANGANCAAGEYPLGVSETGAAESCTDATTEIAAYAQPLEATLTDIADGTIAENLVNTSNPWADNEVADDVTAGNVEGTDLGTLTDGKFCVYDSSNTEIDCTADGTAAALAWNDIGDAGGDGSIALGAHETDFTSTIDAADEAILTFTNTDADAANDNSFLDLKHNDGADANVFYARFIGDADGTPTNDYLFGQTAFTLGVELQVATITLTGTGTLNGLDAIDATGETTLEAALDIVGDVDGTGLGAVDLDEAAVEAELEGVMDLNEMQGQIGDAQIADGAVDGGNAGEIADGSVTADDLGADSVSASELNATGVEAELEAVLDLNELQGQVADGQIADGAVDGGAAGEIADGSVTKEDLAADSVEASEIAAGAVGTSEAAGLDIGDDTNLAAGRSLTLSGDSVEGDAELYTDTKCYRLPSNPIATDDDKSIWINDTANGFTVTKLWCESDQTVTMMLQVDDGSPADMDGTDLVCISTPDTDTSLDGDATVAAGDRIDVDIASVASTPTWAVVCFTGTWDD